MTEFLIERGLLFQSIVLPFFSFSVLTLFADDVTENFVDPFDPHFVDQTMVSPITSSSALSSRLTISHAPAIAV